MHPTDPLIDRNDTFLILSSGEDIDPFHQVRVVFVLDPAVLNASL
jgi:hypothetical protein